MKATKAKPLSAPPWTAFSVSEAGSSSSPLGSKWEHDALTGEACSRRADKGQTFDILDVCGEVDVDLLWKPWMPSLELDVSKLGELRANTAASLPWVPIRQFHHAQKLYLSVDGTAGANSADGEACAAWSFNVIAEFEDGAQTFCGFMAAPVGLDPGISRHCWICRAECAGLGNLVAYTVCEQVYCIRRSGFPL